jgi:hypothetical protein
MDAQKPQVDYPRCQTQCWPAVSEGDGGMGSLSLRSRSKLMIKRHLSARTKRSLKGHVSRLASRKSQASVKGEASAARITTGPSVARLKAGDQVRVRPREEIEATLDFWGELRGCLFMESMAQYCGTIQRVLKPVERFVDERDYRVKRAKGLILLEGLICEGTPDYGRCDRACFYFWREEWLEKIDSGTPPHPAESADNSSGERGT